MADNIYSRRVSRGGGGILGRGVLGEVRPAVSAGDQYRQYQKSMVPPPNPLISGVEEFMRQAERERAASPENAVKRGLDAGQVSGAEYADRAMSARQDEILRQAEMQAIADLATPSLLQEAPARAAPTMPREDQIGSLLGNIDWQGLLRVFARPEFLQAGVSPAQAFVGAAFAQRQADAASRAAAQKQQLEYDKLQADLAKEGIKAGAKDKIDLSKESVRKIYNETQMGMSLIKDYDKIRKIIGEEGTSGAAPFLIDNLRSLANVFGFNLESTAKQRVEDLIERVKTKFAGSRVFGRELNKQDHEILAKVLQSPSLLTSDDRIRDQYLALIEEARAQHSFNMRYLGQMGADLTIFDTPLGLKMTAGSGNIATRID